MTSKDQLLNSVLGLADALSSVDKLAEYYSVSQDEAINSFIESVLDIVILHNSDGTLLGLEIMMTCGGPTLWIETRYNKVIGTWGSDRFERSYEDGVGLDELVEDMSPISKV
jgi:hypothetical protein